TVKTIATLDRTKEPGATGEPLYQDVVTAVSESMNAGNGSAPFASFPRIIGGRYGLSSKEFTPAMVKGVFDEMAKAQPKNHFTVGIIDDVTHSSIDFDSAFDIEGEDTVRAMFWGLGSDGTVGANKNSIKIIGEETPNYAQGYFVYDSKKSGARTISHLRFGPRPIHSTYLVNRANFVAVHQFVFLERYDVLREAEEGATFLLNAPFAPDEVWDKLPRKIQETIIEKKLKFYAIDAYAVAKETGMGARINTIMQTCFFAISGVLPPDEAIAEIKKAIKKTYGKRGEAVVQKNFAAVDASLARLHEIPVPEQATSTIETPPPVPAEAPSFVQEVTAEMIAGRGDLLPVSMLPADGTYPTATTKWEKRNIALEVPVWEPDICIQCGKCVLVCPHAVIRGKLADEADLANAPEGFLYADSRFREYRDMKYTLQVAVEDCTGCMLCVEVCPVKDKTQVGRKAINMEPQLPLREQGRKHWDFFLSLPELPRHEKMKFTNVKNAQLLEPLFEFSGACPGCGETPYVKLASQLFGDRMLVANATGCSSIYGGNLPTTPWSVNKDGRGPTWSNSLFEDNAEFGLGMRLTLDKQTEYARELVSRLQDVIGEELANALLNADQSDEAGIDAQRQRVAEMKTKLEGIDSPEAKDLLSLADALVKKSVWIMGGDGWAYDIGYGGLDHVLASGRNVNVLVLDTEVYSNTGGQASKATQLGAVAKFAAGGKPTSKKDLGMMAMSYGYVYVAQVAMGAKDAQTMKAFLEAESYDGPSLIIAYSPCIAWGMDMAKGMDHQKLAVETGYWPIYRFDPRRVAEGKNPLQLDMRAPKRPLEEYLYTETRFNVVKRNNPEAAAKFLEEAQAQVHETWHHYEQLAKEEV
ncbi:MAG TPA: pyruvate:ferredoxin (flavodoxin) oxidoreductase, partial [Caldilineae bacterium]|nr:pyruvate:ferredoxin (flavodoxin) oxidoreductase [Caldilineae bacterium]